MAMCLQIFYILMFYTRSYGLHTQKETHCKPEALYVGKATSAFVKLVKGIINILGLVLKLINADSFLCQQNYH